MTLQLYNSLSKKKEPLISLQTNQIGLYVCGMTVYDVCHVGHGRVLVAFDVIVRYLRARGLQVNYVRNITDIDNKIIQRADANHESYTALTQRMINSMHADEQRLSMVKPDHEPRATEYIPQIIAMINTLMKKGFAYQAVNGDIYYAVDQFKTYGQLTNTCADELLAGARVDINTAKRDPRDFALWKAATADQVHWDSPWGKGRPGWHIECSAMSVHHLGATFDIHGGGPDLRFPHHENEIAQSEAATGKPFARYWMHVGPLQVGGQKMSKSLGNFFTLHDILSDHHPEALRYLLISSHYRSTIDFSTAGLQQAKHALDRLYRALVGYDTVPALPLQHLDPHSSYTAHFIRAMEDDFNTPNAIAALFDCAKALNQATVRSQKDQASARAQELKSLGQVLGLLCDSAEQFLQKDTNTGSLSTETIEAKILARAKAKANKDYVLADNIRTELAEQGILLEDSAQGTHWRRS